MDRTIISARQRYQETIRRLSKTVPAYGQLCLDIYSNVTITWIDFDDNGQGRPDPPIEIDPACLSDPEIFVLWMSQGLKTTKTRYVLVEDINMDVCSTLGSVFDIDPQFFLDHVDGQLASFPSREASKQIHWGTWNLPRPYISFHWYRPVSRSTDIDSAARLRQIEEGYERVRRKGSNTNTGRVLDIFTVDTVRAASSVLRPEWDLSTSTAAADGPIAIEERVSIYQTTWNGHRYVIMLLDAVPRASIATWTVLGRPPEKPYTPPANATKDLDLYKTLVPRFTPTISATGISELPDEEVKEIYETMSSTMACLLKNSQFENQVHLTTRDPCSRFPFINIFDIVLSDTLGLLRLLDAVQRDIVQSIASQDAEIDDILHKRTFIAKLLAQLPLLRRTLVKSLEDLLKQGSRDPSKHRTIDDLDRDFENTIQDLKEASNAITGTLQFIESHRAILEAESVTRLTELAFLFIPLSFSASLFSMQIKQLANPVPVSHLIAFALGLSTLTYGLRLISRSALVHTQKQSILNSIRAWKSIPHGAPVPNSALFAWIIARFAPAFALVFISACCLVPLLTVLWTRDLDSGLRIALTFLFLLFVVPVCGMIILAVPSFRRLLRYGMRLDRDDDASLYEDGFLTRNAEPLHRRIMRWTVGGSPAVDR
ncbi:hypothetical protein BDV18DRAFT_162898 [Aspergillus unguis]